MAKPLGWMQVTKESAPFIASTDHMVDHLVLQCMPRSELEGGALTPSASALQATWPVSTDELLATSVIDRNGYSPFRLGKFYEAVDALTADVAYRHTEGHARGLALVTASHYHAIKLGRTVAGRDFTIRCYITSTGSSSLEVRTDALQVDESGQERLINVCHTAMVALDKSTMRPVKGAVPPLELPAKQEAAGLDARDDPNPNQIERLELAKLHKVMMARRRANEMLLQPAPHREAQALVRRAVVADAAPVDVALMTSPMGLTRHGTDGRQTTPSARSCMRSSSNHARSSIFRSATEAFLKPARSAKQGGRLQALRRRLSSRHRWTDTLTHRHTNAPTH